jgi:hypothetical protein
VPLANPKAVDVLSKRVGNYQYSPQLGVLINPALGAVAARAIQAASDCCFATVRWTTSIEFPSGSSARAA